MSTTMRSSASRSRVTLHGRELAYIHYPGVGVPLLLVHGVGSSADGWAEVAEQFASSGRHVISVDMPGHGDSSREPGDYSLGSLASTLRDLLDHLGIEQAIFVGHSLGGGVSLQFHYQFPHYVAGLVLVSSGGLGTDASFVLRVATVPGAGLVMRMGLNRRTLGAVDVVRQRVRRWGGPEDFVSDKLMDRLDELSTSDGRNSFLWTLRSVVDFSGQRVSALEKLHLSRSVPVLIIWGEKDHILPVAHGYTAHELLPGSQLEIFDEAGHEPHRSDPDRFVRVVEAWQDASDL